MNKNKNHLWLDQYFGRYSDSIFDSAIYDDLIKIKNIWEKTGNNGGKIIFAGNGGSAAIASHCSVDLTKAAGIRAINFNEADLITCFANDYGYENWVTEAIKAYLNKNDMIILISSSGTSKNIVNAAKYCKKNSIQLITLSGFKKNNPLSKCGNVNFHINSNQYNFIEMSHHIILVYLVDIFAKNKLSS